VLVTKNGKQQKEEKERRRMILLLQLDDQVDEHDLE
jgi:hypothetical protein